MAYSASIIANAFVRLGIREGLPVTQMKLQKMVYFAHGYHLAEYGEPLIEENFEAWKFGPVVQPIYDLYKEYGISPIKSTRSEADKDLEKLDPRARAAIEYTWKATSKLSAMVLSNWTHKKDSPWYKTYRPNVWSIAIDNNLIKDYFKDFLSRNAE